MSSSEERVLCVKTSSLLDAYQWPGRRSVSDALMPETAPPFVSKDSPKFLGCNPMKTLFDLDDHMSWRARRECETDPHYLQIIPVNVFFYQNPKMEATDQEYKASQSIFTYIRSKKGGEGRLHGLQSISVGGHINTNDIPKRVAEEQGDRGYVPNVAEIYAAAVERELTEEVKVQTQVSRRPVGLIYAPFEGAEINGVTVGAVHLGVVTVHLCRSPDVYANCDEMAEPHFHNFQELYSQSVSTPDKFESWAKIILHELSR